MTAMNNFSLGLWQKLRLAAILLGGVWLPLTSCQSDVPDDADNTDVPDAGNLEDGGDGSFSLSLQIIDQAVELTDLAWEAVAVVPNWLKDDLSISLNKLEDAHQDELALLIVGADDVLLVDEIAFAIAHTSPEVLGHDDFYSELIVINAEYIYAADAALGYVELIEEGEPGVDPDHYTTALLKRKDNDVDGGILEETIDRDMYYWYVVHPRLEDEQPFFIDAWSSSTPTSPSEGHFWREFYWEAADDECPADRTCPVLKDVMVDVETVNEANGKIWGPFMGGGGIVWGAQGERSVQPCRIYGLGRGNCGEFTDMFVAASRTALIPARNVGAHANDHTWGEWWNTKWFGELYGKSRVIRDRIDDNCDGVADDALDDEDQDGDGFGLKTDCNDADAEINPDAIEVKNGYDDDCDGIADNDLGDAGIDADEDGFSIADGDCNDQDAKINPDADDPHLLDNRLYGISDARGDSYQTLDRTEFYGTLHSEIEFAISDTDGAPVDGAMISLWGPYFADMSKYAPIGELITGLDGKARATIGEFNEYYYKVRTIIGDQPSGNYIDVAVDWTEPYKSYALEISIPGTMPPSITAVEADLTEGAVPEVEIKVAFEVESYRVAGDGLIAGTFSLEREGGRLDYYLVDAANYAKFLEGEDFESLVVEIGQATGEYTFELPWPGEWIVLLANQGTLLSTMVGSIQVGISPIGDLNWTSVPNIESRFQIPPGEHFAVEFK